MAAGVTVGNGIGTTASGVGWLCVWLRARASAPLGVAAGSGSTTPAVGWACVGLGVESSPAVGGGGGGGWTRAGSSAVDAAAARCCALCAFHRAFLDRSHPLKSFPAVESAAVDNEPGAGAEAEAEDEAEAEAEDEAEDEVEDDSFRPGTSGGANGTPIGRASCKRP